MRTIDEINKKIREGKAVVLTAEEVVRMAKESSVKDVASKVDVVTTATFAPMCSSGAFINFGHTVPPMRMEKIKIEGVDVYGGIAAVDGYIGATQESEQDKTFGGAHIIEGLIRGKNVYIKASGKGTDCYPRKNFEGYINKYLINDFFLFNPRNAYQNYSAATNSSDRTLYTYMGKLLPQFGNVTYATSGELSPLLKDPKLLTIGLGTRIFLCGTEGYVVWMGTQYRTDVQLNSAGIPTGPARTLAVIGNAKNMNPRYIRAAYFKNYGVTLFVGIGVPIPILNEEIAYYVTRSNEEIETIIRDYGRADRPVVRTTSYAELRSGFVEINGRKVKTSSLSSLWMAREIAQVLKNLINEGKFFLTQPSVLFEEERVLRNLPELKEMQAFSKDEPECVHCGACVSVCEFDALTMVNGKRVFEPEKCTNCLICIDTCPIGVKLPPWIDSTETGTVRG